MDTVTIQPRTRTARLVADDAITFHDPTRTYYNQGAKVNEADSGILDNLLDDYLIDIEDEGPYRIVALTNAGREWLAEQENQQ